MKKLIQNATYLTLVGALSLFPCNAFALTKDETVYTKLGTDGVVDNISVVEHLVNDEKSGQLKDHTSLTNLENLNGFENFVVDGEEVIWDAAGNDIYYSGQSEHELPVKLEITYKLNGEQKPVADLLGKSGQIEIRFKFTNLSKVDDLYTPFVVALATTLSETNVTKVSVINGEATSNGRTIAVAAAAAPGLYDNLGLVELKNLDEVVLTYETKSFELNDIYAVVTPEIFNREDLQVFEQLDELYRSTDQLSSSSRTLVSGSERLKNGVAELKTGISTMKNKIQTQGNLLDPATLSRIKSTAASTAEQHAAGSADTIRAAVHQQVTGNTILMNALGLQAAEMCSTQTGGAPCSDAMVAGIKQQLINGVEEQLVTSSLEVAKTTARQTAEATAETVATQVASSIQTGMSSKMLEPLNTLESAIDQLLVGATNLNSGLTQFDREGVQTLVNFVNNKVRVTSDRLERLTQLAAQYDSYAGIAEGTSGETKFIYMVEGKKPEQDQTSE